MNEATRRTIENILGVDQHERRQLLQIVPEGFVLKRDEARTTYQVVRKPRG